MNYKTASILAVAVSIGVSQAIAREKPPENSMKLSEIVSSLESKGFSPITEITLDDGVWEAEACKDGKERELKVNPVNA